MWSEKFRICLTWGETWYVWAHFGTKAKQNVLVPLDWRKYLAYFIPKSDILTYKQAIIKYKHWYRLSRFVCLLSMCEM